MLLIHQAGSVKVGEVVRYTLTYTPSDDRILPSPAQFHVKIRNTSSIPLRAAYLHGPYTVHVSAYPSTFNPHKKLDTARMEGLPQFEPNLKAGGSWIATLTIPENIRESGEKANIKRNIDGSPKTVTWIIEVASQIIFSNTATVNYELLVGRDRRSLDLGFAAVAGKGHGEPGQLNDVRGHRPTSSSRNVAPKGIYSKAVHLLVEDTAALWDKPALPQWEFEREGNEKPRNNPSKKRKLHLVILTHGMHSNLGADMLYMKESIDTAAKQAHDHAKREKALRWANRKNPTTKKSAASAPATPIDNPLHEDDESEDEQVIVRGFNGNAVRTERGIQYLGKRLAKYILTTTYPDQPFLPPSKSMTKTFTAPFTGSSKSQSSQSSQQAGTIGGMAAKSKSLPYTFTSISFVGHSLGGLIQTYAIAYIHKHSPEFFKRIKPVNFVTMASPLLGLSNENPLYVKFALDFGLVGRTGQDLGLTWRAPTLARSGWSAMISGFGGGSEKEGPKEDDPRSKPLLRILPTGPAHEVLKTFRNRTVYSNVVNDGIVPLRTSCLLFLDWRGLGRVENARRENGLIGTMAAFGWAELTGANSTSHRPNTARLQDEEESDVEPDAMAPSKTNRQDSTAKLEIETNLTPNRTRGEVEEPEEHQLLSQDQAGDASSDQRPSSATVSTGTESDNPGSSSKVYTLPNNPLTDFINFFRPAPSKSTSSQSPKVSKKTVKTFKRAQTLKGDQKESESTGGDSEEAVKEESLKRPTVTRGDSLLEDPNSAPPPKTSIFDAAGHLVNPPLPPESWLIDPSSRSRAIFHDRIYYPQDIPPPPARRPKMTRSFSSGGLQGTEASQNSTNGSTDSSGMRVEEKIARAYHSNMAWRKVLVRLEPDAHNNIIVRRMFANAFGWDVIKHLCDTHFANMFSSNAQEGLLKPTDLGAQLSKTVSESDLENPQAQRTDSEAQEERDHLAGLDVPRSAHGSLTSRASYPRLRSTRSQDSSAWNDSIFDDTEDENANNSDEDVHSAFDTFHRFWATKSPKHAPRQASDVNPNNLSVQTTHLTKGYDGKDATIADQLTQSPLPVSAGQRTSKIEPPQSAVMPTYEADAVEPLLAEEAKPETLAADGLAKSKNTAELGLQKPPDAIVTSQSPPSSNLKRQPSVTETVARASLSPTDKNKE